MRTFFLGLLSLAILSILVFAVTVLTHPAVRLIADGVIPVH